METLEQIALRVGDTTTDRNGRVTYEFDNHGLHRFVTELGAQEPVATYRGKESEYGYETVALEADIEEGTKLYAAPQLLITKEISSNYKETQGAIREALRLERERCAKECADYAKRNDGQGYMGDMAHGAYNCAEAIRALEDEV